jgi:hypothetical protein
VSFLAPLWIAGLAALLVPLAIHLLGRGKPPRVPLPSVRLLTAGPVRVPRRARLQRPWLLLLRCALFATLVLALAGPRVRAWSAAREAARPWVLVEPGLAEAAVSAALAAGGDRDAAATAARGAGGDRDAMAAATRGAGGDRDAPAAAARGTGGDRDAMAAAARAAGGDRDAPAAAARGAGGEASLPEAHWLAAGLPAIERVTDTAALPAVAAVPGGLWSLLREADAAAAPGVELRVVTSGRLANLHGERPRFARPVSWQVVAPDGTAANASPALPRRPGGGGAASTAPPRSAEAPGAVPASAPPLRVAVWAAADRGEDAAYVRAALRAVAAERDLRLELAPGDSDPAAAPRPDLAFWLSAAPPPAALVAAAESGATVVLDAQPAADCPDTLRLAGGDRVAWRRCPAAAATPADGLALWRADSGQVLLTTTAAGSGRLLRLAGRFHPGTSDLVLSPAFPRWLRELTAGTTAAAAPTAPGVSGPAPAAEDASDGGQGRPGTLPSRREPTTPGATALAGRRAADLPAAGDGQPPAPRSPAPERALWLLLPLLVVAVRAIATRTP